MVTFICDNCDATLKKKQVKGHQWSCRSPSFTCVDCHKSFPGNEYEAHTSCMTEQEKYWGPYYKGNKQVKTEQQTNKQATNKAKQVPDDIEEKKEEAPLTFNGWKNTLKAILKREENNELNRNELKKKLKEILDNEGYDTEEKTLNQNISKVLGFRAFKVSGNGLVKYLPPSERPAKKSAAAKQKEAKEAGDGKFDWEKRLITILKTEPSHKLKVKRVKKKLVEEYLQKFPKVGEEKAEDLFDEITGKMEGIAQDSKFIQWIPSSD